MGEGAAMAVRPERALDDELAMIRSEVHREPAIGSLLGKWIASPSRPPPVCGTPGFRRHNVGFTSSAL
jgi:hypothetical protein